uniref:Uncharacterized protein n=1 Tax=Anguilla anguilla TaxID=7936 RepID=A0A0E9TZP7_ANGAN
MTPVKIHMILSQAHLQVPWGHRSCQR